MKPTLTLLTALLLAPLAALHAADALKPVRPNILFILADDLGIDGVSCYGADRRRTPEIDRLAASGTRFETCYAAPVCGPSRCLLMTGRYAFRTGGLVNESWRPGGPGARPAGEQPVAKLLKQAGYATGMAGKWRQLGETPREWGFDEYSTDPSPAGWYWQATHLKNGAEVKVPEGTYAPDVIQNFTVDFIRSHKGHPFFFYYSMHLVHRPILNTPDSPKDAVSGKENPERYDDNIAYMDKQVGGIVAELEKLGLREKTLVIFSGDNGSHQQYAAPVRGRKLNGHKGTMLEGGSRVPFIASWPGTTPAGKVSQDIVSFADPHATFLELAGVKPPEGVKFDSHSFAPQLRGARGAPRGWAYVQYGGNWFVREPGFKMNEAGELFDMSDAPFVEKPVAPGADTAQSRAARARLDAVLAELNPAGGKRDVRGAGGKPAAKQPKKKAAAK
ncbi:MAG: sulfatase-like hydrolase/transferase [Limisphaerales bacterium]